jgi:biopolymer transport protein ExbB
MPTAEFVVPKSMPTYMCSPSAIRDAFTSWCDPSILEEVFRSFLTVGLLLSGCGFRVSGGTSQDANDRDDAAVDDGDVPDMVIDEMPPPIDGDRSDWWNADYTHRRRITLDTSSFTGTVTDFPVLVRLPALAGANASGADLRFVTLDGNVYPHELDSFSVLGPSSVWVRMTIAASSVDTELWLYYGNPTVPTTSNGASVFASNHVSVHHLGSLLDATNNGHTASNGNLNGVPSTNLGGRVGAARTFDGNDDYLQLANGDGSYDFTTSLYVSAWIRVAGFEDPYQAIVTKGDSSWRLARANNGNGVSFGWTNGTNNDNLLGNTTVANGAWHHVAIVQTQTTKSVYVDGVLDESVQNGDQLDNNNFNVRFGMNEESTSGGARYWHGDIDEVRISSLSRDAHWIFAEHRTTDAMFTTVGVDEIY